MNLRRASTALLQSALLYLCFAGIAHTQPLTVSVMSASTKVCQVDGEVDWETGVPTAARTLTNFGLGAADLGFPVEYKGSLILLFGDSWPSHPTGPDGELSPNDAVGITTRTASPTSSACLDMTVNHYPTSPPKFMPSTVLPLGVVKQGWFNVPSGGVSSRGVLYGFFWTDHCAKPSKLVPSPSAPLARPAADANCPETDRRNSVGSNALAQSTDDARTFTHVVQMPIGFVYATGVDATSIATLPSAQRLGVYIIGVPRYRASIPYLAYSAPGDITNPAAWHYFVGRTMSGTPKWVSYNAWQHGAPPTTWSPPGDAEVLAPASPSDQCVGEFSVTWSSALRAWLMLYNCKFTIEARVAPAIWGPWSAPTPILSYSASVECRLVMAPTGCGARRNFWPKLSNGSFVRGSFYAPFVLDRYTVGTVGARAAVIYWVVSTWNPYEVDLMRTTLEIGP